MPNPQQDNQNQNQTNEPKSDLSREDLERAIKKVFGEIKTEEDLRKSVQAYIDEKSKGLNEQGKELYLNIVRTLPLDPNKTPQEVIDSVDDKLALLKEKFPEGEPQNQDNQNQNNQDNQDNQNNPPAKNIEPEDKSTFNITDNDEDKLPPEVEEFGTLEGYIKRHKEKYNRTRNINSFKKPAST